MKMIILAGGHKSTISEENESMPKPMLPIGGKPLLWHIMKHASLCGINEFIICGGYKIDLIKDYFLDFYIYQSDIEVNTADNTVKILNRITENWKVTIVDTGMQSSPIERVKRVLDIAGEKFIISYGDCLSDISVKDLLNSHNENNKDITVAVARPSGRKVALSFSDKSDIKPCDGENTWISMGMFVATQQAFRSVDKGDDIEDILSAEKTAVYKHKGYFSIIETLRDKSAAEKLWKLGKAPWMGVL